MVIIARHPQIIRLRRYMGEISVVSYFSELLSAPCQTWVGRGTGKSQTWEGRLLKSLRRAIGFFFIGGRFVHEWQTESQRHQDVH